MTLEIVNQIKAKNNVSKRSLQKASSTSNLFVKSSSRLLTKKSILESIEEGVVKEQSHNHVSTKSNAAFRIRSSSSVVFDSCRSRNPQSRLTWSPLTPSSERR
jgi:hypothetical protein